MFSGDRFGLRMRLNCFYCCCDCFFNVPSFLLFFIQLFHIYFVLQPVADDGPAMCVCIMIEVRIIYFIFLEKRRTDLSVGCVRGMDA